MASQMWEQDAHYHVPAAPIHRPGAVDSIIASIGRLIFGMYFLYNGVHHFIDHAQLAAFAAGHGVPMPEIAVGASGTLILIGGFGMLTSLWPKLGATLIVVFLVGVTPLMHPFWREAGPERMNDFMNFTKNGALIGGACMGWVVPAQRSIAIRE